MTRVTFNQASILADRSDLPVFMMFEYKTSHNQL